MKLNIAGKMMSAAEKQEAIQNMLKEFAEMGIQIIKFDTPNKKIFISVPKTSDSKCAGDDAAKYVKDSTKNTKMSVFKIMYIVRDEHWTKEMGEEHYETLQKQFQALITQKNISI